MADGDPMAVLREVLEGFCKEIGVEVDHVLNGMYIGMGLWAVAIAWVWKRRGTLFNPDPVPAADPSPQASTPVDGQVKMDDEYLDVAYLKQKKETSTAYILLCTVGWTGAHHFYLDRIMHGLLCLWTFNLFSLGFFSDILSLPGYVKLANEEASRHARSDGSTSRVLWRLPAIGVVMWVAVVGAFIGLPGILQVLGILDLEKKSAGTMTNPYDILGVQRGAPAAGINAAYSKKMETLRARQTCDRDCRVEKEELRKARLFSLGKGWRSGMNRKAFSEPGKEIPSEARAERERRREPQRERHDPYAGQRRPDWDDWAAWKLRNPSPFGAFAASLQGLHGDLGSGARSHEDAIRDAEDLLAGRIKTPEQKRKEREAREAKAKAEKDERERKEQERKEAEEKRRKEAEEAAAKAKAEAEEKAAREMSESDFEAKDWLDYTFHGWEILGAHLKENGGEYASTFAQSWGEEL